MVEAVLDAGSGLAKRQVVALSLSPAIATEKAVERAPEARGERSHGCGVKKLCASTSARVHTADHHVRADAAIGDTRRWVSRARANGRVGRRPPGGGDVAPPASGRYRPLDTLPTAPAQAPRMSLMRALGCALPRPPGMAVLGPRLSADKLWRGPYRDACGSMGQDGITMAAGICCTQQIPPGTCAATMGAIDGLGS